MLRIGKSSARGAMIWLDQPHQLACLWEFAEVNAKRGGLDVRPQNNTIGVLPALAAQPCEAAKAGKASEHHGDAGRLGNGDAPSINYKFVHQNVILYPDNLQSWVWYKAKAICSMVPTIC